MLTQAMPAVVQALSGSLPPAAVKQLTQALGNCEQPLSHRGAANLQPNQLSLNGGLMPEDMWNPSEYQDILPESHDVGFFDTPFGANITNNLGGTTWNLPTNADFSTNNYWGGSTLNVGGNSTFNSITTNNINTNTINNQNFYGGGPIGPAPPGVPGEPGAPGAVGPPGQPGEPDLGALTALIQHKMLVDQVTVQKAQYDVVVDVTFDPETCDLKVDKIPLPPIVFDVDVSKYTLRYLGPPNGLGVGPRGP